MNSVSGAKFSDPLRSRTESGVSVREVAEHSRSPFAKETESGTRRVVQLRAIMTRSLILSTAAAKFDREGYAGASINEISAAAGITRGATYFHFSSKESIAQQLVFGWSETVVASFLRVTGGSVTERLRGVFRELGKQVSDDVALRAGLKLSLEPAISGANETYWLWVDTTRSLIEEGDSVGCVTDDDEFLYRLSWNLCAGFVGLIQASSTLRRPIDLRSRVEDLLAAYIPEATAAILDARVSDCGK